MHWVDRGPEPPGLAPVRSGYTQRWVAHYRQGIGSRPSDARWREFHDDVDRAFSTLCAYCEEVNRGEVDHFRPKSKFPEMVYDWSNWVFSCHTCNHAKGEKWPPGGYVNPCAKSRAARPETYFDFDTLTGEVIPKPSLTPARREKARNMIDDLRLNAYHHLKARQEWIYVLDTSLSSLDNPDPRLEELVGWMADRTRQLSSIARFLLAERGYSF